MTATWISTVRFVARSPRLGAVLARKAWSRITALGRGFDAAANRRWLAEHSISSVRIAETIDPVAWAEATEFAERLRAESRAVTASLPFSVGKGGNFSFLYWLVRVRRPDVVVETGVSVGWSSSSILSAMRENGAGHLYSSDFPYFRIADAARYIGAIVPDPVKDRWSLAIDGDRTNLPRFLAQVKQVDLFHYDSDKSVEGREFAFRLVRERLAPSGIILMDDIVEDGWFRQMVEREKMPFIIIDGRYGAIGDIAAWRAAAGGPAATGGQ